VNKVLECLNTIKGVIVTGLLIVQPALAEPLSSMDTCLLDKLRQSGPEVSVGQIRAECEVIAASAQYRAAEREVEGDPVEKPVSAVTQTMAESKETGGSLISERMQAEKATRLNPFVLTPHKQNYVLLASYNSRPNYQIYNLPESDFDDMEMKFQLSFKMPVAEGILGSDVDLYAAYTNLSFWQAYNQNISSPFRETVHEPEMFLVVPNDWSLFGWRNSIMQFGAVHQSNGQGGYLSRSWNRIYANFIFEKDNLLLGIKPWHRLADSSGDNPDITEYLGHYELRGIYKHNRQTLSLLARNLTENSGRETYQLDWSFPLYKRWRGYLQYFRGYGESLVDYNMKSNRIGFGLQLTDWL
jgi:phospholipase A1